MHGGDAERGELRGRRGLEVDPPAPRVLGGEVRPHLVAHLVAAAPRPRADGGPQRPLRAELAHRAHAVGVVHAGWRGLAGGVLAEGVRAVRELGAQGPLWAAIGPGAGGCCYEVGDEVRAHFAPEHARGRLLDLKAAAAAQLAGLGVEHVHDCGLCTLCAEPGLLFSHRRDGGVTGRQAGVAWRA